MIERIAGTLERIGDADAGVTPSGSGLTYEVLLPAYLARDLQGREGQSAEFHTLEQFDTSNQGASFVPRLMGFRSRHERRFFELFITVKGVGPRKALRALAEEPARVARAITERDTKFLQGLPEIGKKSAETIVTELREKAVAFCDLSALDASLAEAEGTGAGVLTDAAREASAALTALGESPADAERMVRRALAADPGLDEPATLIEAAYRAGK